MKGVDIMKKNNKTEIIGTIALICIIIVFAIIYQLSDVYQWKWTLIPWVRIIFHAVAAISLSIVLSWIGYPWAIIARESMGAWISILSYPFIKKRNKIVRVARLIIAYAFRLFQPFIGTLLYIRFSYDWENYQAQYYKRAIQTVQLRTDVICSVIGGILWIIIYYSKMIDNHYIYSPGDAVREVKNLLWTIEDEELPEKITEVLQKIVLIIASLIPIWIIIFGIICSWVVLRTMSYGLWE